MTAASSSAPDRRAGVVRGHAGPGGRWLSAVLAARGLLGLAFGVALLLWPRPSLPALARAFAVYVTVVGLSVLADAVRGGRRRHRWADALAGALGIIIGVLAALVPGPPAHLLAVLAGSWAMIVGALDIMASVRPDTTASRRHRTTTAAGVLAVIAGLVILARPHLGTPALADVLGTYALVSAIALLWAARNAAQACAVVPSSTAAAVGARRSLDTPGSPAERPRQQRRSWS